MLRGRLLAATAAGALVAAGPPPAATAPLPAPTSRWAPAPGDGAWADVRAFGAKGDGVADDTPAFRAAAATGRSLFVPRPPVAYVLTGCVELRSSAYGDGSLPTIRMRGADGDPDQGQAHTIFVIHGYEGPGLVVSGLRLDGGWDGRGTRGEWSHCVRVTSSRRVTIERCVLERPYGDCVFVGHYAGTTPSFAPSDVVIRDNVLSGPRRCCVAVVSGTNVTVRDNRIVKRSDYVAAIDLEPDPLGYQHVDGVVIAGNAFDVAPIAFGGGAVSLDDPLGNEGAPRSGNVAITGNRGRWAPAARYLRLAGSDGLVGVVPHLAWAKVTASGNVRLP